MDWYDFKEFAEETLQLKLLFYNQERHAVYGDERVYLARTIVSLITVKAKQFHIQQKVTPGVSHRT